MRTTRSDPGRSNRSRSTAAVLRILAVLTVVGLVAMAPMTGAVGFASAQQASSSLDIGDATVSVDESATVDVSMSSAPNGLSGYDVILGLNDTSVATITNATVSGDFGLTEVSVIDNGTAVRLRGLDTNNSTQAGATDVALASVEVTGEAAGETSLSVEEVVRVDDDNGSAVGNLSVNAGQITVESDDGNGTDNGSSATVSVGDVSVDAGDTATADVTMDGAPTGLAGYSAVFSVEDGSIASVQNATVADGFALRGVEVMNNGTAVRLRAVDINDTIQAGASDVMLGSITVEGESEGTTTLSVEEVLADDDNGTAINVSAEAGQVNVMAGDDGNDTDNGSSATVSIGDATVNAGETTTADVTMDGAPTGLAGYSAVFSVEDGSIASIQNATVADGFALRDVQVMENGTAVRLRAVDINDTIQAGASDVMLGSITVEGESEGTTTLSVEEIVADDDNGTAINVSSEPGQITVEAGDGNVTERPQLSVQLEESQIGPNDTTTAKIVLSEAPEGLAGFNITVGVDGDAVQIADAEYGNAFAASLTADPVVSEDGESVQLRAVDLLRAVEAGAENVTLATVELEAVGSGSAEVNVTEVEALENDEARRIDAKRSGATLNVIDLVPIVGDRLPTDPDGDGLYEDLDGDGELHYNDIVILFEHLNDPAVQNYVYAYNFDGNEGVTYSDIVALFEEV